MKKVIRVIGEDFKIDLTVNGELKFNNQEIGYTCYNTQSGKLFISDGTDWTPDGGISFEKEKRVIKTLKDLKVKKVKRVKKVKKVLME